MTTTLEDVSDGDLVRRLGRLGAGSVPDSLAVEHLRAIERQSAGRRRRRRAAITGLAGAGLLLGSTSLAAARVLPPPAQTAMHQTLESIGIDVPETSRAQRGSRPEPEGAPIAAAVVDTDRDRGGDRGGEDASERRRDGARRRNRVDDRPRSNADARERPEDSSSRQTRRTNGTDQAPTAPRDPRPAPATATTGGTTSRNGGDAARRQPSDDPAQAQGSSGDDVPSPSPPQGLGPPAAGSGPGPSVPSTAGSSDSDSDSESGSESGSGLGSDADTGRGRVTGTVTDLGSRAAASSLTSVPCGPLAVIGRAAQRSFRADAATAYRELSPAVLGYLRARQAPDPEDVLGEVFLQVSRDLDRFRGDEGDLRRWIFTIAHNRMTDAFRRRSRRPRIVDTPPTLAAELPPEPVDDELIAALAGLGDDQREVVVLRFVADLSLDDVAEITGRTTNAVKAMQHRALANLRRTLLDAAPAGA